MTFILLTARQADRVRGETTPGYVLDPVETDDGFILNERVLEDPAHSVHHAFLSSLPRIDL